jgi:metal-dependent amidase/aminoacylase/carboxypeptidase family protein
MINKIKDLASELQAELSAIRRHLHTHPELSFQEYDTARFVAEQLDKAGIPFRQGIAGTGILAWIEGKNPQKKCIALRADMDALPIQEANEVTYRSVNDGVMHACGHDVHTTCLLGAATILKSLKDSFEGTIKLIFQPGEEKSPGGASLMINEGVLDNPTIKAKGGHAALPHQTADPIAIAALIITALQQVVSRKSNPLSPSVLTFGRISGGHTTNVIPDSVEIEGTLRTFDEIWRTEAKTYIHNVTTQIAKAYGAQAIIELPGGYPSLYNDPSLTTMATTWAEHYLGKENVKELNMRMGAEDFSFYTLHTKGCFFRIGTNLNNEQFKAPVHNPHFDIDESALQVGAGLMSWLAINLLNNNKI